MKAIFDSDVLIDYLQGLPEAATEIRQYREPCYSIISWMEIMCGANTEEKRKAAMTLLGSMKKIDLNDAVAKLAVEFRCANKLKLPDAIIRATAESEGCLLITRNQKDFSREDPAIRVPYRV